MTFILFVIVLVVCIYQGSRLNTLETRIKKLEKSGTVKATAPEQMSNKSSVAVTTSVSQSEAPTSSLAAAIPAMKSPESVTPPVVKEDSSGKILGRIGIGAVIIGMAFFLKYAFDNNWIGPSGRVMVGILIGIAVMMLGQWLRRKYLSYSDLLMGGGLAILYLSVYAAHGFYQLIDPVAAFMGMIVVTAIGVLLSILDATVVLSVVALVGGFAAPFLIGLTDLGPWVTFTYITVLNAGILGITLYKKWPQLILIGLIGSWLYFGSWLVSGYNDSFLIATLLFVFVQFLIFNAAAVVRIIVDKLKATEVDYLLLTMTALGFAVVCYDLLMPLYRDYVSLGSVMVAAFYGAVALIAYKTNPVDRTLNIFLPGLAVAFLTIAVPIEFSGPWIAAWWFVEALVLYIVASTSSSRGFQIMGLLVYILGLFNLLSYVGTYTQPANYMIIWNGPFLMLVMAAVAAYVIATLYYRYGSVSEDIRTNGIAAFVIMANIITLYALTTQIVAYYGLQVHSVSSDSALTSQLQNMSNTMVSILWALYAAALTAIGIAKRFATVRRMGLVLFIITGFKVVIDVWALGELYRVISFILFGILALTASFLYVRFKDRLKNIV